MSTIDEPYFGYTKATGVQLSRDKAVERLARDEGSVYVTRYPGAVPAKISPRRSFRGDPEVEIAGRGWQSPGQAERIAQAITEAAAVAREAAEARVS